MADVLKQKCLCLLGHVKQQLLQLMSIWISCKLYLRAIVGKEKGSEGVSAPCWQTGKPLLVNWLACTCIFSLNFSPVNGVIMALNCFWYVGYSNTKINTLLCLISFPPLILPYGKEKKILGQGFCTLEVWYNSGLARVLRWSCLLDLCQQWAPQRSLSDFKLTKPGSAEHKQEG